VQSRKEIDMRAILTAWLIVVATCAGAQAIDELKRPGVVALMRHALAPGTGDPARPLRRSGPRPA